MEQSRQRNRLLFPAVPYRFLSGSLLFGGENEQLNLEDTKVLNISVTRDGAAELELYLKSSVPGISLF